MGNTKKTQNEPNFLRLAEVSGDGAAAISAEESSVSY